MKNVSAKLCRQSQNIILCSEKVFRKSSRLWDNVVRHGTTGETTDGNMVHAHCMSIPKAKNTHSEYAKIIACPLQ